MHRRVCSLCHHSTAVVILGLVASEYRELKTLESDEALANIIIRLWIDGTSLGVSEELVQCIISSALSDLIIGVVGHLGVVDCVINRTVGGILGRSTIETRGGTWGVAVTRSSIHASPGVVVISTGFARLAWVACWGSATIGFGGTQQDGVVGMSLYMLLQILRALEGLATEVTFVWLEGNMDTNM